jgi:hypothetical protein
MEREMDEEREEMRELHAVASYTASLTSFLATPNKYIPDPISKMAQARPLDCKGELERGESERDRVRSDRMR